MKLTTLVNRLKKIGIELECISNYPWIYLAKVNGKTVHEKYMSDYGLTVAFQPDLQLINTEELFKLIRKYK